jgi:hypothetical protein
MASCPPPPKHLTPPPVATIDLLGGAIKIPWTDFDAEAKKAKGYLRLTKIVPVNDPLAKLAIAKMDLLSKKAFVHLANGPVDDPNLKFINYAWVKQAGPLKALPTKPHETIAQYRARGGYLISSDLVFGRNAIDNVRPSWVPKHDTKIEFFYLYATYYTPGSGALNPQNLMHPGSTTQAAPMVAITVELRGPNGWQAAWDSVVRAAQWTCSKITNDKLLAAAAFASVYPQALAVTGPWVAAAAACSIEWPACPNAAGVPTTPAGIPPVVVQAVPAYPPGTIAWRDPKLPPGLYRVAVPKGLAGLEATHVEVKPSSSLPSNVRIVGRFAWETATRPLYARTWFIGTGVGVGAITLTTLAALAFRRRAAHAH